MFTDRTPPTRRRTNRIRTSATVALMAMAATLLTPGLANAQQAEPVEAHSAPINVPAATSPDSAEASELASSADDVDGVGTPGGTTEPTAPIDTAYTETNATDTDATDDSTSDESTSRYVVTLESAANIDTTSEVTAVIDDILNDDAEVAQVFTEVITGAAVELTDDQASTLDNDPRVVSVEPDIQGGVTNTQTAPPWNLDRTDQRNIVLDGIFRNRHGNGAGVRAYVVDTGVRSSHTDFGGRVRSGFTAIRDGGGTADCHGHGTHVAGTIAGTRSGVAKSAVVVPVRVMGCDGRGWSSDVVAGLDWIARVHDQATTRAVVNMSIGFPPLTSIDQAVRRLTDRGIAVVAAAGNDNTNACNVSPARAATAITVGATDANDQRARFSNWGSCVSLFAPGVAVQSASSSSNTALATLSGTSMAAPHVAGAAAVVMGANRSLRPDQVAAMVTSNATPGVGNPSGSPDRLLYLGATDRCGFNDVAIRTFFAPAACWMKTTGLTTGYNGDTTRFAPGVNVNRAQLATIMWRNAGQPNSPQRCGFNDVAADAYYSSAACWMKAKGLTTGYNGNTARFAPGVNVNRAQLATIMWRNAGQPNSPQRCGLNDVATDAFFAPAACWMKAKGLTTGYNGDSSKFAPEVNVDRAQFATILWRNAGQP